MPVYAKISADVFIRLIGMKTVKKADKLLQYLYMSTHTFYVS